MQQRDLFRDTFCQGFCSKGTGPPPLSERCAEALGTTYHILHTTYHIPHTTYHVHRIPILDCSLLEVCNITNTSCASEREGDVDFAVASGAVHAWWSGFEDAETDVPAGESRHGTWVGTCRQQSLLRGEDAEQDAKGDSQEKCPQGYGAGGTEGKHRAAEPPRCARPADSPGSTGSAW